MRRSDSSTTLVSTPVTVESLTREGTYTWSVENFTKLKDYELCSPEFEVGGYFWRLQLFPNGDRKRDADGFLSIYLELPEAQYLPSRMCPKVKCEIIVVNSTNSASSITKEATYKFGFSNTIVGEPRFLSIQELQNHRNAFLVNDMLTLRANICIQRTNLGLVSRMETGFIGIRSREEERSLVGCFLQCMFHIKALRKAAFQMSTEVSDDPEMSLPLALQRLFYKLQYQNKSVAIVDVIRALDWDFHEWAFTKRHLRHDVLKIQRTLFEKLAKEDKVGNSKGFICKLFKGQYSYYIHSPCIQVAQACKESFTEIPLDILGCRDIYSSLERFCQITTSEKDNFDHIASRAVCESEQHALFDSFPSVLIFHLKRCHYNSYRRTVLRINSYYEYHDEMDLDYNCRHFLSLQID